MAQKRQNWGKFFYLQTPKKGVYWPFLALILGTPSQALKIVTVLGCLERVYQVSRPGKANQPLFWAFSVKRMIVYLDGGDEVGADLDELGVGGHAGYVGVDPVQTPDEATQRPHA